MRKTCGSANAVWISADSACADSSECPNGFSTTMRESGVLAPIAARLCTMVGNAPGGTAR